MINSSTFTSLESGANFLLATSGRDSASYRAVTGVPHEVVVASGEELTPFYCDSIYRHTQCFHLGKTGAFSTHMILCRAKTNMKVVARRRICTRACASHFKDNSSNNEGLTGTDHHVVIECDSASCGWSLGWQHWSRSCSRSEPIFSPHSMESVKTRPSAKNGEHCPVISSCTTSMLCRA